MTVHLPLHPDTTKGEVLLPLRFLGTVQDTPRNPLGFTSSHAIKWLHRARFREAGFRESPSTEVVVATPTVTSSRGGSISGQLVAHPTVVNFADIGYACVYGLSEPK